MGYIFSDRIADVPKSFIREILKVTTDPSVISFAGGLMRTALGHWKPVNEAVEPILLKRPLVLVMIAP